MARNINCKRFTPFSVLLIAVLSICAITTLPSCDTEHPPLAEQLNRMQIQSGEILEQLAAERRDHANAELMSKIEKDQLARNGQAGLIVLYAMSVALALLIILLARERRVRVALEKLLQRLLQHLHQNDAPGHHPFKAREER